MKRKEIIARLEAKIAIADAEAAVEDDDMLYAGICEGLTLALELVQQMDDNSNDRLPKATSGQGM